MTNELEAAPWTAALDHHDTVKALTEAMPDLILPNYHQTIPELIAASLARQNLVLVPVPASAPGPVAEARQLQDGAATDWFSLEANR